MRTVWRFRTERFEVALKIERDHRYKYDGDDEDGETQAKLDSGEYIAFDSVVTVKLDGVEVGWSSLGGSIYGAKDYPDFWTAHRDSNPMNRNCTIMRRAYKGENNPNAKVSICHYFPGMVSEAVEMAREIVGSKPYLRAA